MSIRPTTRMDWLEKQIKIQEDALVRASESNARIHAYLLEKLTNEWCYRSNNGEVTHADYEKYMLAKG